MGATLRLSFLVAGGLVSGSLAVGQQPFTEEAPARGLIYFTPAVPGISHGAGVSFADMDGDGDPDALAVGGDQNRLGLFENLGGGTFADRATASGFPTFDNGSGVVAFDGDMDGDLDLLVTRYDRVNHFAWNLGGFQLAPDVQAFGFIVPDPSTGPSVGDVNGDGWLDVHIPQYAAPDQLYTNQKNGTFLDLASTMRVDDIWHGMQSVLFDSDGDGDLDLVVSNDKHDFQDTTMHNRFYRNDGGTFVDRSVASGLNANIFSMGIAVGYFNGDLRPDLYFTNVAEENNPLFVGQGGNNYVDATFAFGVQNRRTSWGATFFDYDNDSHADLYVCNRSSISFSPQNRLLVHEGGATCQDVGPLLGVDDYFNSFCNAIADVDADGDLDLMVQNNDTNLRLYMNHEGSTRNWIRFHLVDEGPNKFAVGAKVTVKAGGKTQRQQLLLGGNGFKGQNELRLHFGLDTQTMVDEVVIRWPDGFTQSHRGLDANRTYRFEALRKGLVPGPGGGGTITLP